MRSDATPRNGSPEDAGHLTVTKMRCPPTEQELGDFRDIPVSALPRKYRRVHSGRVFVNRELNLTDIKWCVEGREDVSELAALKRTWLA